MIKVFTECIKSANVLVLDWTGATLKSRQRWLFFVLSANPATFLLSTTRDKKTSTGQFCKVQLCLSNMLEVNYLHIQNSATLALNLAVCLFLAQVAKDFEEPAIN